MWIQKNNFKMIMSWYDGVLVQVGGREDGEKLPDFRYILKVEPTECIRIDKWGEGNEISKNIHRLFVWTLK